MDLPIFQDDPLVSFPESTLSLSLILEAKGDCGGLLTCETPHFVLDRHPGVVVHLRTSVADVHR